ncbi:amino acid ABC transporter ATP-binding protein [Anaerosinus gibii]|uniref:Amino acid ABC transporter ATP-binding protein n=1 Tax=Selenobaculum gibii TaxID=3054208 RepID=A0A9Y2AJ72_9FIRM|nr:amino acid ABC transporter ATP-binding protein [Selenobaculum gbiensis]WIW71036.1 amino acid ABC transporter ATP-binding protein [Selenobaculum gbiensis]
MLEIRDLTKDFGDIRAVDHLALHADKGETVVIMGPSGCGKSTTIRMINRLVEPDFGTVFFDGIDITGLHKNELLAMRKRIGYVFQHFNLIARLTALENVMLGLVMGRVSYDEAKKRAVAILEKVGLGRYMDYKPSELSGGQQQRVAIARALAFEPELILWDEPTASLDPILVREVLVIMEELAKYRASTMLVVTHELSFALKVADRILLMNKGKIVESGKPIEIFTNPQSTIGKTYKDLIDYQMNTI